jgi:hypothetical protein
MRIRRLAIVAVAAMLAAGLGIASAQWWTVPNGNGHAYGHGKNSQTGVAVTSLTLGAGDARIGPDIGPSETGNMFAALHNSNAFPVTVASVAPATGAIITSESDAGCTAPASTFTLAAWTGTVTIAANSDQTNPQNGNPASVGLPFTTTAAFPSCLAGSTFSVPVVITATAS